MANQVPPLSTHTPVKRESSLSAATSPSTQPISPNCAASIHRIPMPSAAQPSTATEIAPGQRVLSCVPVVVVRDYLPGRKIGPWRKSLELRAGTCGVEESDKWVQGMVRQ